MHGGPLKGLIDVARFMVGATGAGEHKSALGVGEIGLHLVLASYLTGEDTPRGSPIPPAEWIGHVDLPTLFHFLALCLSTCISLVVSV